MEVRAVAGIFKHSWLVLCECGYTEHNLPTANMARGLHDIHLLNVMEGNYITANA